MEILLKDLLPLICEDNVIIYDSDNNVIGYKGNVDKLIKNGYKNSYPIDSIFVDEKSGYIEIWV